MGIVGGTSKAEGTIVGRLHAVFTGVLQLPDVRERLTNQEFDIIGSSPAEFAGYIKAEIP
jgi:tripartite-type tricarboxylate transporter receptor subunit TctC